MAQKPRLFIGSSVEGRKVADAIQLGLDYAVEATIWHQGVFGLSQGTLESLVRAASRFDYAALVLTPDDLTTSRDTSKNSPRDNVVFELGLFMGALGPDRTFIVHCRDETIDLPTDLAGVTPATFAKRSDDNLHAALGAVCTQIQSAIENVEERSIRGAQERVASLARTEPILSSEPTLYLEFGNCARRETAGATLSVAVVNFDIPRRKDIPDYEPRSGGPFADAIFHTNRDFYRDLARYIRVRSSVEDCGLAVRNDGDVTAEDVRVVLTLDDPDGIFRFLQESELQEEPERETMSVILPANLYNKPDIVVRRLTEGWRVEALCGKVQPKATVWTDDKLFVGAERSGRYEIKAVLYSDNLRKPVESKLHIDIDAKTRLLDNAALVKSAQDILREELKEKLGEQSTADDK